MKGLGWVVGLLALAAGFLLARARKGAEPAPPPQAVSLPPSRPPVPGLSVTRRSLSGPSAEIGAVGAPPMRFQSVRRTRSPLKPSEPPSPK